MIIEGMELKVLQLEQENPYTMVRISHMSNGVTYEARGWTLWDGQGEWSNEEGAGIAVLRAKRKIAGRLRWEMGLDEQAEIACAAIDIARSNYTQVWNAHIAVVNLHQDGGTVRL